MEQTTPAPSADPPRPGGGQTGPRRGWVQPVVREIPRPPVPDDSLW